MAIRFDKNLNSQVNKAVSAFNKKVKRLSSRGVAQLPDTIDVRELKLEFRNRRDLMRELSRMSEFTKRGGEKLITTEGGAKLPKWELTNLKKDTRIAKARLTRQINKAKQTEGKVRYPSMHSTRIQNLSSRRSLLNSSLSALNPRSLRTYRTTVGQTMNEYGRRANFQKQYIENMIDVAGWMNDQDKEFLDELKTKLSALSPDEFWELYEANPELGNIRDVYKNITSRVFTADADNWIAQVQGAADNVEIPSNDATEDFDAIRAEINTWIRLIK